MQASQQFLRNHLHDYNNCEANNKALQAYILENELEWTTDNLEIALHALESQLAPVASPVTFEPPANPVPVQVTPAAPKTPVATAVSATPVAASPVVQPVQATPVQSTPPANPAPAQPRPGVNGGVVPGQSSGVRPTTQQQTPGLTVKEVLSWDGKTMREKMKNPNLRAQIVKIVTENKNSLTNTLGRF